jgi:hypothetical protein
MKSPLIFLFQPNYVTNFQIHILFFNQKFQIRLQKDFEPNIYASNDLNVFATFAKLSLFQTLFYVCVKQWSNLVAFSVVLFAPFRRACSTVQWRWIGWIYSSNLQIHYKTPQKLTFKNCVILISYKFNPILRRNNQKKNLLN